MLFSFQILKYADIVIKKNYRLHAVLVSSQSLTVSQTPGLELHIWQIQVPVRCHYKYIDFLYVGSVQLNRKDNKLRQLNTNDKDIKMSQG